jgi:predicted GH43/DUF377 family glycosyl hydrolase
MSSVDRATHLAMQTVGNLVLYNGAWQAAAVYSPGAYLVVQDDANVVLTPF